ncbi:hypothetical protein [Caulobacter mirabilis]|uniref:Uncharacterized protein n=1 Tax=Caulobacter mirabilis TaxID=69666 RepID=A0A2D2B038_9CAUL|nr:hypothetical protein [Caulobacter mirabilis]ATQ43547.1 hypothetical protein CSW64_14610 [Caulobacter mirabilis]
MELITLAGGGLTGGALGAAFGALGSILNRGLAIFEAREKRKDRQLELTHEKERWDHDLRMAAEARTGQAEASRQALAKTEADGRWTGLAESLRAEAALAQSWPWVAAVRALTRPALTLLLWLLFALLFLSALAGGLREDAAAGVVSTAVETIAFSASTALAWWFGDRAPRREG